MKNQFVDKTKSSYLIHPSPFGQVAILWILYKNKPKIIRVLIPKPDLTVKKQLANLYPKSELNSCLEIDTIADNIESFLKGVNIKFSLEMIYLDICSKFQKKVLCTEHKIPRGKISTYQNIARHLNIPKGARAVGNALANNPFPIIIPCHRVIRANRTLGGYQGGLEMKRALLEMEGSKFDEFGRIILTDFYFRNS